MAKKLAQPVNFGRLTTSCRILLNKKYFNLVSHLPPHCSFVGFYCQTLKGFLLIQNLNLRVIQIQYVTTKNRQIF